jgi:UDP-N-acetylglucosamine--N-acetylmuramyl-(pentapeptide) pyrophosphoryl-undecaprenol N-acetylglucosamine transferase
MRAVMSRGSTLHPSRDAAPVVHLACSRGGHFDLLLRHRNVFADCRVVWVTQESARAEKLRGTGEEVHVLGEYRRSIDGLGKLARAIWRSFGLVLRQRPRLVVTSGSGLVVPFCLLARLGGARVVFVETSARVRSASSSGAVLSRIASRVIVQWEGMRAVYRNALVARTSVVEELATGAPPPGAGTFVGVGTHSQPFDRLLELVDRAAERGVIPQPVTAQVGHSRYPMRRAVTNDFISPDEMATAIGESRYVVCHAGTGTISTALRAGRRPLVLARLARHHEHFDDHQQQIVDRLAELDLVVPIGHEITEQHLEQSARPLEMPAELKGLPTLADSFRGELLSAFPVLSATGAQEAGAVRR